MKKFFSALFIIFVSAAALCLYGCVKSSSSEAETVRETENYDKYTAPVYDLSSLESTISFDSLDLSEVDRIYVWLAYCDPEIYSYWIEDADTICEISDMVKGIDGEGLFCPAGLLGLEVCVTFYRGDSEVFHIGLGGDYFESGSKIKDSIGAGYTDAYYYAGKRPTKLINMLIIHKWEDGQ